MKSTLNILLVTTLFTVGCNQENKNILSTDTWACPKHTILKTWKDGYPGEEKKYKALGCRANNGDRVGYHIAWKDYGIKEHEGSFVSDEPDGEWSYFHDNGLLDSRGFFHKGEKEGVWSYWDDKGRYLYDKQFENGEEIIDIQDKT